MPGTWHALANQPTFNTSTMILLTDGRVMVQEEATRHWHALTPDSHGSYLNGTWSPLADMSFWRRYYASGVLKDGRVIVVGGEQTGVGGDTNRGEIYNPVTNAWAPIALPPWASVGDASCCMLPDGRLMIGSLGTPDCEIYDPSTNTWTAAASKAIRSNEETWILLRDNTILTAQCFPPYQSEKYIIATNTWKNEGALPVDIVDHVMSEIGPGMLMYNGKVIYFGAADVGGHGKTVLYTPPAVASGTGTWTVGPDIPLGPGREALVSNDCPAALLPNGNVLFTTAPFLNNSWGSPVYFFEYDPVANTMNPAPAPANNGGVLYSSRMMLLPSGEVLYGQWSHNLQIYQPTGAPHAAWRPGISSVTHLGFFSQNYLLEGARLNGLSQANIYGDDCYPATNYPLVRLTNSGTGHVYYARTNHFSTMGIHGSGLQSCHFTVPAAMPFGSYRLCVIANGISSPCVSFEYQSAIFKSPYVDSTFALKEVFEHYGKLVAEGDPWEREEWVINPEIKELQSRLQNIQSSLQQVQSLIQSKELPEVGKQVARTAVEEIVPAQVHQAKSKASDEAKEKADAAKQGK